MYRMLLGLVVVVVVVAVGAVAAVWFMSGRDDIAHSPSVPAESQVPAEPHPVVAADDSPPDMPLPVVEMKPKVVEPKAAEPSEPEPAVAEEPPFVEPGGEDVSARVSAILDSLTEEEQHALMREMGRRRMERWREEQKYRLPVDNRLTMLRWHRQGAVKLSEGQEQQVEQLRETMKPRIDAALEPYWAQEEELRRQVTSLYQEGRAEEAKVISQDLIAVSKQIHEAKESLNEQYRQLLAGVLTAEQAEVLDQQQQNTFFFNVPGGGRGTVSVQQSP